MDYTTLAIILVIVNIPLYIFLGKMIFTDLQGFVDAIWYWFKPDIWSWISGDGWEDMVAEFKLGFFVVCCGGAVFGEFYLISKYFLN